MAIIRYCGSEPKVNQCLNISFSCWRAKASFFPCSLYLVWIKNEHQTKHQTNSAAFLFIFCVALGGSLNAVFVFLTEFIICRRRRQAKVWPWGDSLNQINDWLIMRTVFERISLYQYQWTSGFSVEPEPNVIVHCTSTVVCFKSEVNAEASLHTNENISMRSCLSAYEYSQ